MTSIRRKLILKNHLAISPHHHAGLGNARFYRKHHLHAGERSGRNYKYQSLSSKKMLLTPTNRKMTQ